MKNMFKLLVEDATSEIPKVEEPTEEIVDTPLDDSIEDDESTEEEDTTSEDGLSKIKSDTQGLIMSILDAIEQDELTKGSTLDDDESADIGLELIYKIIPKIDDADVQEIYDTLSEYFDMDVDEDYFETPSTDIDDLDYEDEPEEDLTVESKKKL